MGPCIKQGYFDQGSRTSLNNFSTTFYPGFKIGLCKMCWIFDLIVFLEKYNLDHVGL